MPYFTGGMSLNHHIVISCIWTSRCELWRKLPIGNAALSDMNGALEIHLDVGRLIGVVLVDERVAEGDAHHQAGLDALQVTDLLVVEV